MSDAITLSGRVFCTYEAAGTLYTTITSSFIFE